MPAPKKPVLKDRADVLRAISECLGADAETRDPRQIATLNYEMVQMMDHGTGATAPVRELLRRVGDRWSTLLLVLLCAGSLRYSELKRIVDIVCQISDEPRISQRMLTLRLRALERDGLVARRVQPTVPPRVDYALTPMGQSFFEIVAAMLRWGEEHDAEVRRAQTLFDAANPGAKETL
jgi:DNA-binding HxlR family transcriptional regulator